MDVYLGVFLICGVHDGSATDLGHFLSMTEKGPKTNLLRTNDILEEKNSTAESQTEFVKQFKILEQIVVRSASKI